MTPKKDMESADCGSSVCKEMVETFLDTEFTEGLEEWRQEFLRNAIVKVDAIENEIYPSHLRFQGR